MQAVQHGKQHAPAAALGQACITGQSAACCKKACWPWQTAGEAWGQIRYDPGSGWLGQLGSPTCMRRTHLFGWD